jgi:hydrogenase maturation protease
MEQLFSADVVVFGLGNILRTDDGVGIHALRALQTDSRVPAAVALYDGGTLGLELACYAAQASKILLLDAIDVDERPGTVIRMSGTDLAGVPGGKSVHQLGLADLLSTLSLISDQPKEMTLLGIQPASTDWGTTLSPTVEAAVPLLATRAIELLLRWTHIAATTADASKIGTHSVHPASVPLGIVS